MTLGNESGILLVDSVLFLWGLESSEVRTCDDGSPMVPENTLSGKQAASILGQRDILFCGEPLFVNRL